MAGVKWMTRETERIDGDHSLVELFEDLQRVVEDGRELRHVHASSLEYGLSEFRRRCRRLDRWRKQARCRLEGVEAKAQRSLRSSVTAAFRALILSRMIDEAKLTRAYRPLWRDNVERAAAVLLLAHHRQAIRDGGLSRKVVEIARN
jgi:hypothetical protein